MSKSVHTNNDNSSNNITGNISNIGYNNRKIDNCLCVTPVFQTSIPWLEL